MSGYIPATYQYIFPTTETIHSVGIGDIITTGRYLPTVVNRPEVDLILSALSLCSSR